MFHGVSDERHGTNKYLGIREITITAPDAEIEAVLVAENVGPVGTYKFRVSTKPLTVSINIL